jgi:patatin-like phospholipase/acyl hydrolase
VGGWNEVQAAGSALVQLYEHSLETIRQFWEKKTSLEKLGRKVSPTLRREVAVASAPMQRAMKQGTWDEIAQRFRQLPAVVSYPQRVVRDLDAGERIMEFLGPTERRHMAPLFAALDAALQGKAWQPALAAAAEIVASPQREFGNGEPLGWPPCIRILSIDGGGVRGIIPAMMLAALEAKTKTPIAQLFDYVVGTSTGGILALGLTAPDPDNPSKPRYEARQLVETYESEARKIFPEDPLRALRGMTRPKYGPDGIEQVLREKFGDTRVGDALTNVLIPAYALETREHFLFSNETDTSLFYMRDAARATSAAPTYFPPFRFRVPRLEGDGQDTQGMPEDRRSLTLIDGGVFANNPTVYGLAVIRRSEELFLNSGRYGEKRPWLILSLGTGQVPPSASIKDVENASNWGLLDWAAPLVDIMFSESGIGDEAGGQQLFAGFGLHYFRLQPRAHNIAAAALDNASPANIQQLKRVTDEYIQGEEKTLRKLASLLLREKPRECRGPRGRYMTPEPR